MAWFRSPAASRLAQLACACLVVSVEARAQGTKEIVVPPLRFEGEHTRVITLPSLAFAGLGMRVFTAPALTFEGVPAPPPVDLAVPALGFEGVRPPSPGLLSFDLFKNITGVYSPDQRLALRLDTTIPNLRRLRAHAGVRAPAGHIPTSISPQLFVDLNEGPDRFGGWRAILPVPLPAIPVGGLRIVEVPFTLRGVGVIAPGQWPVPAPNNKRTYYRYVLIRLRLAMGAKTIDQLGPYCYDAAAAQFAPSACGP